MLSFKNFLRGSRGQNGPPGPPRSSGGGRSRGSNGPETVANRQSRGLEEFFGHIRDLSGLTILDLGGATQQNVSFITNLATAFTRKISYRFWARLSGWKIPS